MQLTDNHLLSNTSVDDLLASFPLSPVRDSDRVANIYILSVWHWGTELGIIHLSYVVFFGTPLQFKSRLDIPQKLFFCILCVGELWVNMCTGDTACIMLMDFEVMQLREVYTGFGFKLWRVIFFLKELMVIQSHIIKITSSCLRGVVNY